MIKRISAIALLTGAGQLLSVFALKYIAQRSGSEGLKALGETDSLIQFIIYLIAAGLQSVAMRNMALTEHWQEEYAETQSARLSFGLLLTGLCVLGFVKGNYLLFALAPLLALSGDYALYGLGHPVTGATVALSRVAIPYSLTILAARYRPDMLVPVYVASLAIVYLATSLFISYYIHAPYFVRPRFRSLVLYLNSLWLGIVNVAIYFLGLGILLVVPYFYDSGVTAVAFVGLKVYVIYKGVLRIVHQAFLKDMIKDAAQLQVDQLSILLGITFGGSALIFPHSFIRFFFGSKFVGETLFFQLLALSALIYSVFLSMSTNILLKKRDKQYGLMSAVAVVITLTLVVVLAGIRPKAESLAISLFIGEVVWMSGLLRVSALGAGVWKRLGFLLKNLVFLLVPISFRWVLGDSELYWFCGFGAFALILLILHLRKFLLLASA